jgi:hypothetical protein
MLMFHSRLNVEGTMAKITASQDYPPRFVDWNRDASDILSGLAIVLFVTALLLVLP